MSPASGDDPVALWARRIGGYVWLESRLFELLGRWSGRLPDDRAAVMAAVHSRHHGWRAEQWGEHLPLLGSDPPASFLAAPSPGAVHLLDVVGEPDVADAEGAAAGLAGVYRVVVPELVAAYRDHARVASAVSEAPTLRMLQLVGDDLARDGSEGERTTQRLIGALEDVLRVTAHLERVTAAARAAGSLCAGL